MCLHQDSVKQSNDDTQRAVDLVDCHAHLHDCHCKSVSIPCVKPMKTNRKRELLGAAVSILLHVLLGAVVLWLVVWFVAAD